MENKVSMRQHALKRKFYMALPVLVLPFITALYWLWVVRPASARQPTQQIDGLMTSVPDAVLGSEKQLNKLSFYRQAEADSAKLLGQIRKDPYLARVPAGADSSGLGQLAGRQQSIGSKGSLTATSEHERKVFDKLRNLDQVLSQASAPDFEPVPTGRPEPVAAEAPPEIRSRLTGSYTEQQAPASPDPEIEQLSGVLDKILAIQDPDRQTASGSGAAADLERKVLAVGTSADPVQTSILAAGPTSDSVAAYQGGETGFFALEEPQGLPLGNAISAEVDQDQNLLSGQILRLRLSQDVFIAGSRLPRGTLVSGKVSINNQRLMAEIESIYFNNTVLPVRLTVYDLDGIAGIHIPDELARQVAKQSLSQDVQGVDIGVLDPSLAGQAVGAGIQTAKSLLSRKTRLIQITVNQGYRVLLLDKQAI